MRRQAALTLLVTAACCLAADLRFTSRRIVRLKGERIAGAAVEGGKLATWGDRLTWRSLPDGRRIARGPRGPFAEGGAILDVDGDGHPDWIVNETAPQRELVWFAAPHWTRHVIDTGVVTADVIPATLFGRRGILLVHRRAQVRFYEIPSNPAGRWPVREIYSFYTPSDQGGLLLADIDGDGRPDILCGNYWIRSPESFDLPWRLFAIELWNEEPHSAMLRLTPGQISGEGLQFAAVQREMPAARLAWFEKPADPKQLWVEHRLDAPSGLDHPRSLAIADFDGDGRQDLLVAESEGAGRLVVFYNAGAGRFVPNVIAAGVAADQAILVKSLIRGKAATAPAILTISGTAVSLWTASRQ